MKINSSIKLNLSDSERKLLRQNRIKKTDILGYAPDELSVLLDVSEERAKEIYALADFQRIPSVGIKFAQDLIFLGYHSILELKGKSGAALTDSYEQKKGFKTDPCVEDQFRLAVYFASNEDYTKRWWDFTQVRKDFRNTSGYPSTRPKINWTEVYCAEDKKSN